jgi:hypothetical protein
MKHITFKQNLLTMRKIILVAVMPLFFSLIAFSANTSVIIPVNNMLFPNEELYSKISSLKIKDVQRSIGRKLTLKEKIGFLIVKHQLKHRSPEAKMPGNTAFTVALTGLGLLILGLFVPYVILGSIVAAILAIALGSSAYKRDHSDKKAHAAKIIGWLTLGITALLLIIAAIIIATWTSWI